MKRSEMTSFDLLQLDPADPVDFLEIERRAHKLRAEAVAEIASSFGRSFARLFSRSAGASEASL
ncbi:RSP_7527 family protein [Tropicimonas sediminicola]|uniref:Uncharacterized protein n=1 Tax=Tropicimonas sediminicola TaxID=1031541 RepID=A0A239CKJ0_9RHOB|nr:hypothetical protein [Tropicimonas sediminicola]SNS20756.1 hypothetical protein SAMN05421757_101346 [Tropicimonas sediminicola]